MDADSNGSRGRRWRRGCFGHAAGDAADDAADIARHGRDALLRDVKTSLGFDFGGRLHGGG